MFRVPKKFVITILWWVSNKFVLEHLDKLLFETVQCLYPFKPAQRPPKASALFENDYATYLLISLFRILVSFIMDWWFLKDHSISLTTQRETEKTTYHESRSRLTQRMKIFCLNSCAGRNYKTWYPLKHYAVGSLLNTALSETRFASNLLTGLWIGQNF